MATLTPPIPSDRDMHKAGTTGVSHLAGRAVRPVAVVAAVGLVGFAAFQAALALGVPLGAAAWGGADSDLTPEMRVASGLAALLLLGVAFVVLGRAGYWHTDRNLGLFRWGTWGAAVFLALGSLGNFASSSNWEQFLNGPLALLLALACFIVALGSPSRQQSDIPPSITSTRVAD